MKESFEKIGISKVVIDRLPLYFRTLRLRLDAGMEIISSDELGQRLGITPEQIRKDLASFGQFGKKGVGYRIVDLISNIGKILGVLSVGEEDYFDIGIMGEENKRLTDWMRIDGIYLIGHLLEEVSNNLLRIDGCEILSKDLQELSESIIPENTLKNEDKMA